MLMASLPFYVLPVREPVHQIKSSTLPIEQAWQFQADEPVLEAFLSTSDVFIRGTKGLYAVSRESGEKHWYIKRDNLSWIIPPSDKQNVVLLVTNSSSDLEAIDSETGRTRWRVRAKDIAKANNSHIYALTSDDDKVFVGISTNRRTRIVALNLADGRTIWDAPQRLDDEAGVDALLLSHPWLVAKGEKLWYLHPHDGQVEFTKPLPPADRFAFGERQIFAIMPSGGIRSLDPLTAHMQWNFRASCADGEYEILTLPKPPSYMLLVTVSCPKGLSLDWGSLYVIDAETGKVAWHHESEATSVMASAAAMGQSIYTLRINGSLYALDALSGEIVGELHVEPSRLHELGANASVVADQELLILLMGNSQIFAFKPN